ncbi:MAG: isopentenyl-diphosphate delta-isomerase [Bacteroidetes bacterium]|nr:isopentenyl-diphosphate delta-isomerase [Bacteroidota bacterium]
MSENISFIPDNDPTASSRKQDHIELAFRSQVASVDMRNEFYYEPLLSAHPAEFSLQPTSFGTKKMKAPLWVSSMTGGTALAGKINNNLAQACAEFGLGMGLGSCRPLLYSDDTLSDYAVRPVLGPDVPFYANLGIAQIEKLWLNNELYRIPSLLEKLSADGLIIHINPLQEWLQPEGDRFTYPPVFIIQELIQKFPDLSLIVKEVGQGMGPQSLKKLLMLPLTAVEFAAGGGTNFSKLELFRAHPDRAEALDPLTKVGHNAHQMVDFCNDIFLHHEADLKCHSLIISGGIQDFLHGYYLVKKSKIPAVYGQASLFLKYAREDYQTLQSFVKHQLEGLTVANHFLTLPPS